MIEFDIESPYDEATADAGLPFRIERNGKYYGTFTLRYVDSSKTKGQLEFKRVRAMYAKQLRTNQLDEYQAACAVLCHVYLTGWEGITAKGKEVPFSVETALAFFANENARWIALKLVELAADDSNFAPDEEFAAEDISKN
ncbi:hypothetical protein QH494_02500 [Sphingomonas sp. AR_OL41]|uniref:hypothetical protein n=1 Tax=Sphingomonas sp. AR_OL41 TaxID=3042729 RepID=UPI002480BE58|nr:hypothetical protein [Sphingomonas sp. AR_OL41]MDH7971039.1 hypothetical protein [Sphingomonas sp. AR_OL41]